jgi:hypothetical protein
MSSVTHVSIFSNVCEFRFAGKWQLVHLAFVQQQTPSSIESLLHIMPGIEEITSEKNTH